jgi:hypothetical protein
MRGHETALIAAPAVGSAGVDDADIEGCSAKAAYPAPRRPARQRVVLAELVSDRLRTS